jgi:hypothetical protein
MPSNHTPMLFNLLRTGVFQAIHRFSTRAELCEMGQGAAGRVRQPCHGYMGEVIVKTIT